MRIVHTSDWHIGKTLGEYSLIEDQEYWFDRFFEALERIKPDLLIIAGDLYDRAIPPIKAVSTLDGILSKIVLDLKIKTFIISGNHDSRNRLDFGSELLEQSGLYIGAKIEKEIKMVSLEAADFYFLSYFEPHNIRQFFPDIQIKSYQEALTVYTEKIRRGLNSKKLNFLIAHGSFANENTESVGGIDAADISLFDGFDYVALGHFHSFHPVGSKKNAYYSGSPLVYSIDEISQKKGFAVITAQKGKLEVEFETIEPLHRVRVETGDFASLLNLQESDDYIFFELTDKYVVIDAMPRLKACFPNTLGLKYLALETTSSTVTAQAATVIGQSTVERFERFFTLSTSQPPTEEEHEIISEICAKTEGYEEADK